MDATPLRLFPLHGVLFPGMALPLHVFEPRYLRLVAECRERGEPFGVALIREGPEVGGYAEPFEVGATARVERADPGPLPDSLLVLARGERRFRIVRLHRDRPYLRCDAEPLAEPPGEAPDALRERARAQLEAFARLRPSARGERGEDAAAPFPRGSGALADAIGATGAGSAAERQRLLETLDPAARLARAVAMFEGVLERLRERAAPRPVSRWSVHGALN